MRMRRTVRNAWVEALRSGEYEQVEGALAKVVHDMGENVRVGYCCLGVLSELALKGGCAVQRADMKGEGFRTYDGEVNYPPFAVAEWVSGQEMPDRTWQVSRLAEGGDDPDGEVEYVNLADVNDGGAPFTDIADLIENDLDAADDVRDDLPAEVQA